MTILAGVGASNSQQAEQAAQEAYEQANKPLEGKEPSFLIVYATAFIYKEDILLATLKKLAPNAVIIGASSSGEITSSNGVAQNSVAVMAIYSDKVEFTPVVTEDIERAGKTLAEELLKTHSEKPKAALIIHDALQGHGVSLLDGVLEILGNEFPIVGAGASDGFAVKETHQFFSDKVLTGHAILVGLYGDFSFGIGARHGWRPVGKPHMITKAEKNVIFEIDNKPAGEIYKEYLGIEEGASYSEVSEKARYYPIGVPSPTKGDYLIRNIATINEDGSIVFPSEMPPTGVEMYLTMAGKEECIQAAEGSARDALVDLENKNIKAALLFDCITRKAMLIDSVQEEIDRMREIIGKDVPLIGFYSYGEIGALGKGSIPSYNNESAILFLLAE